MGRIENTGDIKLTLNTQVFKGSTNGNGDLYLEGTTKELVDDDMGTNYLYASNLKVTGDVYLHSASIGHAYVSAPENGRMEIILDKSGNVFYTGNPSAIHLTKRYKGNLIKE